MKNYLQTIKRRLRVYKLILIDIFADVSNIYEFWIATATVFNHLNIRLRRKIGIFFPFSLGIPTDELKDPVGKDILKMVELRLKPVIVRGVDKPFYFNVMIPTINPELMFGGYIGLFNFLQVLLNSGYKIRLMVCEDAVVSVSNLKKRMKNKVIASVLEQCELVECYDRTIDYEVGNNDLFIGYSWLTMRLAYHCSTMLNGKRPLFFIQEYEPIFYHYDSIRFLADETYRFQHNAIYNSTQLKNYFEQNKLSVFSNEASGKYCVFNHAIADIKTPDLKDLENREIKKVLVYARPEKHAGRNMFEISMMLLKEIIQRNYFEEDKWDYFGIGSLGKRMRVDLGQGNRLKLLPRMSYNDYTRTLSNYDLGISLMYAPHPSVPPLEMASAGMITVTTCFENRTPAEMSAISKNIIAADHSFESLLMSIKEAIARIDDYQGRIDGSKIHWPRSWEESFNHDFLKKFEIMIVDN